MLTPALLKADPGVRVEEVKAYGQTVILVMKTTRASAACPVCHTLSRRVHTRYERKVADLPWQGTPVCIQLHSRRFHCKNANCPRSIFTERIPNFAAAYARRTNRLNDSLSFIGAANGGRLGAKLSTGLAMSSSKDTLVREIRRSPLLPITSLRVVGIDDFALRKGQRYGTIIVDLEKHQVIDLLPDREAETVKKWLQQYSRIEIISRDRAQAYAEAATAGAPQAVQIADRFHIIKNLMEAVEQSLSRHHSTLRQAAVAILPEQYQAAISDVNKTISLAAIPRSKSEELRSQQRREKRLARYQEVQRLYKEGLSIRAIERELGMDREAIRNFIKAEVFPERALVLPKPSIIDQYLPLLKLRWEQGCYNVRQLYREIQKRGYNGSRANLYRYLKPWRSMLPEELKKIRSRPAFSPLSPKQVAWLLLKPEKELEKDEQQYLRVIFNLNPEIKLIQDLTLSFQQMLKNRTVDLLDEWIKNVEGNNLPEFQSFVNGIKRDEAAVRAGLTYQWSNGQVEGQVNRLKFIKRSMYGRAKFDLLKKRVLIKI